MMNFMRHLDKPKITSISTLSQCLKIDQKVAFNTASEASYVYILSGQKSSLKMPKMVNFCEFLENLKPQNSVTRQVTLKLTKIGENVKIEK